MTSEGDTKYMTTMTVLYVAACRDCPAKLTDSRSNAYRARWADAHEAAGGHRVERFEEREGPSLILVISEHSHEPIPGTWVAITANLACARCECGETIQQYSSGRGVWPWRTVTS